AESSRSSGGETALLLVERAVPCSEDGAVRDPGARSGGTECAATLEIPIEIERVEEDGRTLGRVGVASVSPPLTPELIRLAESLVAEQRYGPVESLSRAAAKIWEMSALTVRMLGR